MGIDKTNTTDNISVHMPEDRDMSCCELSLDARREKIAEIIKTCVHFWEDGDSKSLAKLFAESGYYSSNKEHFKGKEIEEQINKERSKFVEVHLFIKRSLVDTEQMMGSMEAIMRTKASDSKMYHERQMAWIMEFSPAPNDKQKIEVSKLQVWTDPVWNVTLNSLETPLPTEIWKPAANATPMTRKQISEAIIRKIVAYTSENMHLWGEMVHSEVIIHPPWDMLLGRDASKKSTNVYFQNYSHTQITPLRLMHDDKQPNFAVYQQIFKTTNKSTGEQGEDWDFVFIEVVDSKIRYWRTYFDTTNSAQKTDNTFRQQMYKQHSSSSLDTSPPLSPSEESASPASTSPPPPPPPMPHPLRTSQAS